MNGSCPRLKKLSFSYNGINDKGAAALAAALGSGALGGLEEVGVSNNNIGDDGAQAIADALTSGACGSLRVLWLGGNHIGDRGALRVRGAASTSPCHVACATQANSRPQGACSAIAAGATGKRGLRVALVAHGGRVPAPEFEAHIARDVTPICPCHVACVVRRVRCVGKKHTIRRLLGCSGENHSKEWFHFVCLLPFSSVHAR